MVASEAAKNSCIFTFILKMHLILNSKEISTDYIDANIGIVAIETWGMKLPKLHLKIALEDLHFVVQLH